MAIVHVYSHSFAVVVSCCFKGGASLLMTEGFSSHIILAGIFSSHDDIHSLPDLDDVEGFQLTKGANVEHFGLSMSEDALDEAIKQRITL